ncbi:DNA polymerase III subunit beta [Xanthobacter aminoxidans]|uniref:DNA polymerase III subunit beta n=1 Tax=Xanthobacter aminoxidans TaxID=186280 RepID=UPI00202313B5|nr:DNA polymerase III subunit beta [Xanthobacter aminoxidans]MCL8385816.1 DNA polymerase III subunit beta [Xanthobacter aminoxidans]
MKLTISRDALAAALDRVGRVVETRNTIPILSNVRLSAHNGTVSITGTDLDMEAISTAEADVSAAGETTLPAKMASDFVRKLPAGAKVELSDEGERGKLTIKSGRSRISVNTLDAADFPDLSAGAFSNSFALTAAALLNMLDRVDFAISSEETRYFLNGIYLHVVDAGGAAAGQPDAPGIMLRAVATDGHRLAQHQVLAPQGSDGMAGIIVPRKAVGEMGRLLKPLGEESVRLEVSTTKLRLTAGVTTLTTKLIDGTFPDYGRVVPSGNDKLATLDKAALGEAVARVSTVSSERGRAVRFSFAPPEQADGATKGALTLTVQNPDMGNATDELEAAYDAEPLDIGFNASYVADILAAVPGAKVTMAMADPGSPCLITPEAEGTGSLFVLMPMRV